MRVLKIELTTERLREALGIKHANIIGVNYDSVERLLTIGLESESSPEIPEACFTPRAKSLAEVQR